MLTHKNFYFFVCILLSTSMVGCRDNSPPASENSEISSPEISRYLTDLDTLLSHSDQFISQKEERIKQVRENLNNATNTERKFWFASELYDEFSAFDSDSALKYANYSLDLARELQRPDLETEMQLNRSYVLSATGLLDEAAMSLQNINVDSLPPNLAQKYCERMIFLSSHREQYLGENSETDRYYQMSDSLMREMQNDIQPGNPEYNWLTGWNSLRNKDSIPNAIHTISSSIDKSEFKTRQNAMDAWILSKLYEENGNNLGRLKYLILSAMADVRASNKEVASLEELAGILYSNGDLDRANSYINHSIANANDYKSRVRLSQLANIQEQILGAIHQRSEQQVKVNHVYLVIMIVALCILILATIYIMRQNKLLRKSRETLNEANVELSKKVEELSSIREELNDTNAKLSEMYSTAADTARELADVNQTKEAYIADVFAVCSGYIDKLETFRANLSKLLAARKFDEASKLIKSPELSYHEVRALWETFDEIFLELFPDFVEKFNTLLKPEAQITLKKEGHLTNELRIYALVRLGMNDSQRIAKFLHCSVQTVYNTRQRMRNKAIIPRHEFANAVKSLGKEITRQSL